MENKRWEIEDIKRVGKVLELECQAKELREEVDHDVLHKQIDKIWDEVSGEIFYDEDILLIFLSLARKAVLEMKSNGDWRQEVIEKYKNHFKLFD